MCLIFPRDVSAAGFKLAQHILMHLLGYFKNLKDLSIQQPKAEKKQEEEEKRKHDSGKLSDGDKIDLMIIIYIYAFSRRFYPKRLTIAFRLYIFISICVPWESNPKPFALLTQCSTTEPHRNTMCFTQ